MRYSIRLGPSPIGCKKALIYPFAPPVYIPSTVPKMSVTELLCILQQKDLEVSAA